MVVSYDEKTLIMWDMKAGAQKASFTADKVRLFDAFPSAPRNTFSHLAYFLGQPTFVRVYSVSVDDCYTDTLGTSFSVRNSVV